MNQPELAILLLCLGDGDEPAKAERLAAVPVEEWQAVAVLAKRHAVAPQLHHRLKQLGIPLPDPVAAELKGALLRNTARNMRLYQELGSLLRKLQAEKIPVIVLKGAYLAEAVYDNIGLRMMTDIDLLIPEKDVEKAIGLLETAGFKPERPFFPEADGVLHYHAPPMVKNGTFVELHWNLTRESNLPGLNTEELWARSRPVSLAGCDVRVLSLGDLVLHLAVHAAYGHQFHEQFRSLVDLVEIFRKYESELDWDAITQTCRAWQAERGTYLTLRLVKELLGGRVPAAVLEWAEIRLFQVNPVLSENYIRVMHGSRLSEKLAALRTGLFPSRGVMAMLYGTPPDSWRIAALYPRHVVSRIGKYWGRAWELARGDQLQTIESESDQALRDWLKIG
jgi:hypothetical protein